jgi:hypothetical protein
MLARAGECHRSHISPAGVPASRSSAPRWNAPTCDVAIRSTIPDLKDGEGGSASKSAAEHRASRGESCSADSAHQLHRNAARLPLRKRTRIETQTCARRSRDGSSSASVIRTAEANTTTTERKVSRKSLRARATSSSVPRHVRGLGCPRTNKQFVVFREIERTAALRGPSQVRRG